MGKPINEVAVVDHANWSALVGPVDQTSRKADLLLAADHQLGVRRQSRKNMLGSIFQMDHDHGDVVVQIFTFAPG